MFGIWQDTNYTVYFILHYIYIRLHPFIGPSSVLVDKYQNITMIGLAYGSTIDNCGIFRVRPRVPREMGAFRIQ